MKLPEQIAPTDAAAQEREAERLRLAGYSPGEVALAASIKLPGEQRDARPEKTAEQRQAEAKALQLKGLTPAQAAYAASLKLPGERE